MELALASKGWCFDLSQLPLESEVASIDTWNMLTGDKMGRSTC